MQNQWGGPCWCRTFAMLYCVGQPQCKEACEVLGIGRDGKSLPPPPETDQ
jgi:hypothetical protein